MFIQDQIRDEVQRDVNLQFTHRNPNYIYEKGEPVKNCPLPPLMYLIRWIAFYKHPDFIH